MEKIKRNLLWILITLLQPILQYFIDRCLYPIKYKLLILKIWKPLMMDQLLKYKI